LCKNIKKINFAAGSITLTFLNGQDNTVYHVVIIRGFAAIVPVLSKDFIFFSLLKSDIIPPLSVFLCGSNEVGDELFTLTCIMVIRSFLPTER